MGGGAVVKVEVNPIEGGETESPSGVQGRRVWEKYFC